MASHIFICYTHENHRFVVRLARDLHRQGLPIWLDQWDLPPQVEWDKVIKRAIWACSHFLLVLSPAAVNSWVVHDQFKLAIQTGKIVVPVLHRPCELPPALQDISVVDFTGRNYNAALRQLLAHAFPQQAVRLDYLARPAWGDLSWSWRRDLLPGLISIADRHYRALSRQVLSHYFPDQVAAYSDASTAVVVKEEPHWPWLHRLLDLLWPGWLGPLLLTLLLVWATFSFWPAADEIPPAPVAFIATLEVIRPTATPELLPTPVELQVRARDGKVMVYVPEGEFIMGSDESDPLADEDEKPLHRVYLDAFWIDKTEITNDQYQLCVDDSVCTPAQKLGSRFNENYQPVIGVNWSQAATYCQWVGGRLPTEAEWEKAARGIDGRLYPWGSIFDGRRLNFCDANCIADWRDRGADDGYSYTAPVGNYPEGASPYGVLDMSGNVWEWTADWYDPDYYERSHYENPTGPDSGLQRVVRGGSWLYYGTNLRVPNRHRDSPSYRYDNIGFRCVADF